MASTLTTSNGNPVEDNQNSITAGQYGPILLQDFALIDKLTHFDRERIPERVVHAKGAGAHGYFEVTHDISKFTKAKFLNRVGKRTPLFTRFSTVGGEKGSADTARDPRGFAVKFYTEEGNWDMVGNNTPVFFIRDPIKFPDFIHTQKRNPQTNCGDPDAFWDFISLVPETLHQLVNEAGESHFVKWHFKCDQGIKNFKAAEAAKLASENPDYATADLFNAIAKGDFPSWSVHVQVMTPKEAATYRWNPFDVTKVWPQKDYPLIPVGKMVLNRNPDNYFAEVEQAAFSPSHMVPGIEASTDRMLQGRLFSYPDTQRHRLGTNYQQIPINVPYNARIANQQRDGHMAVNGNGGSAPNYEPNSFGGAKQTAIASTYSTFELNAIAARHIIQLSDEDFVQPGNLYRLMSAEEKSDLIDNMAGHLKNAKVFLQERQVGHIKRADKEWGSRLEAKLKAFQSKA
ncbi:hypothetical protein BGZ97_011712 [Linnemannia gamsii]|uniref:Catalase n=1 Tax=Linnemannia gamsii TaxID=64522 RepID=A0A9P6R4E0_9FUNG|nr:hypothetical protein BGZ97_011712 [Linnemannia gamsii]